MTDIVVLPTTQPRAAFTIYETARLLGVSDDTVTKAIKDGRLQTVEITKSLRLVPAWSIAELLADPRALPAEPGREPAPRIAGSRGAQDDSDENALHEFNRRLGAT